jgi:hypothetical protein
MLRQIETLLRAPTSGADAPSLADMEHALTDGYARALALEAERSRLQHRLGQAAHELGDPDAPADADEISSLAKRLRRADGELSELRSLLGTLQRRRRTLRYASST